MRASEDKAALDSVPVKYAPGTVFSPPSNYLRGNEIGTKAHTNAKILIPPINVLGVKARPPQYTADKSQIPPISAYFFETPASLACVYELVSVTVPGCSPNRVVTNVSGGSRAIAIVDAYDHPAARSDLNTFSRQFGLPVPTSANFQVAYANGIRPPDGTGSGWDVETALDIEYAHGLAPRATVYLVEAASSSIDDMFQAVDKARQLVAASGGGQVSMSWGGSEFRAEVAFDTRMTGDRVVYFAAAGDYPGTLYPCVSPNVVCVGGTANSRNRASGQFQGEIAWSNGGGGRSQFESRPTYQDPISGIVGARRGVPDVAAIADPNTGVWIFSEANGGWIIAGGTSVATPVMAAIANVAGHFAVSSTAELTKIYATTGTGGTGLNDVTSGACGLYDGFLAFSGWDYCTGIGTPRGSSNKIGY